MVPIIFYYMYIIIVHHQRLYTINYKSESLITGLGPVPEPFIFSLLDYKDLYNMEILIQMWLKSMDSPESGTWRLYGRMRDTF